jgi:hypothetical protein
MFRVVVILRTTSSSINERIYATAAASGLTRLGAAA